MALSRGEGVNLGVIEEAVFSSCSANATKTFELDFRQKRLRLYYTQSYKRRTKLSDLYALVTCQSLPPARVIDSLGVWLMRE